MHERAVEVSARPEVIVRICRGNLRIGSGKGDEVRVLVSRGDDLITWEQRGEFVVVALAANGTLMLPPGASAKLEEVLGNLHIEGIQGSVEIGTVHGNVTVRDSESVSLERVLGNLRADGLRGDLTGDDVRGNVWARGIQGAVTLASVAGNLEVEAIEAGLTAEVVRGNVTLWPPFSAGSTYRLETFGNLRISLPDEASLRLELQAEGDVDVRKPGLVLERRDGEVRGTLGAGEATLKARVKGNVTLLGAEPREERGMDSQWGELGARIEWQVHDAVAKMATQLERRLGTIDGEWVRHRVDGATVEARRKAEQAAERARMRAEQAERRWRRAAGERVAPEPSAGTDEERLRVLRMVEERKITPEQAADLLGAIEGR